MEITIITPTYNRAKKLCKLYNSLKNQTNKEFIWLIIDDGSTDNTEYIINQFISENRINIEYYKKQNGGKHTALNMGIKKIQTDLTFIVDSDDWLEKNAVETINMYHKKYKYNNQICGYSFLRKYSNGTVNGKFLDKNEVVDDYINIRINGKDTNSDKAEVWKTKCLNEYPFPEFKGEKFLGEDIVWIQMALKYKMVFINEAIYVSEYLEEGLTKNRRKNNIQSPNGCYFRAKKTLEVCKLRKIDYKYYVKNLLQLQIYGRFAQKTNKEMRNDSKNKVCFELTSPLSYIIYIIWKNKS